MTNEPVDIWQRLKRLSRDRTKICGRIRRVNHSIGLRVDKLQAIGKKYNLLMEALENRRDEFSEEQIELIIKLMDLFGEKIDKLTTDITDLAEPNIELYRELEENERQIRALEAIVEAEVGSSDE
ncbi:MAG: hypothetical protein K2X93_17500 [Candidatus Obscuribacterales bacterium]|nr:hypothetical protein [Candidatus Obscuribacterales bacterium]